MAEVRANSLFTDHAVLQRGRPIPIFGTGPVGASVVVELDGNRQRGVVGKNGHWRIDFPKRDLGDPFTIKLNGSTVARDVVVGEVWIASGQSNMEWPIRASAEMDLAIRKANPSVRQFYVEHVSTASPLADVAGRGWTQASASTVPGFSAVAYWFATKIHEETKVPVGIIHTSWGGTPAESWTSMDQLKRIPSMATRVKNAEESIKDYPARKAAYDAAMAKFTADRRAAVEENLGEAKGWHRTDFDDELWESAKMPTSIEESLGKPFDGGVWVRREIELPASFASGATLHLGPIDDYDITYVNGTRVGATGEETPQFWSHPRKYEVPAGLLRPGRNVVAVRIYDTGGGGGFSRSFESEFGIMAKDGTRESLAGSWQIEIEREFKAAAAPTEPFGPGNPWLPSGLYNAMIAPIIPYGIRGAIWYQGESNADRAEQYRTLFPAMIQDWRTRWGQGDFPFYYVQLANFMARQPQPVDSNWAELRDAQDSTLKLRNTGMATAIDVGEAGDIHPRDKRSVGERLAQIALARDYGKRIAYQNPRLKRATFRDGEAIVELAHADGLKLAEGSAPTGFAIAGSDRKFHWATGRLLGNRIILSSPNVPKPVAVRYLWEDNPPSNLKNAAGLPAVPFRTDDWPGITRGKG